MEESILMTMHYGQVESSIAENTRITEGADTRITESGDTRITNELSSNAITSSFTAIGTIIAFASQGYVYQSGWKTLRDVYVKRNGSWVIPERVYKKENGEWKRVL